MQFTYGKARHYQRWRKRRNVKNPDLCTKLCRDAKAEREMMKGYADVSNELKLVQMLARIGVIVKYKQDLPF